MAERTQRLVDGPHQEFLTKEETAAYLRMDKRTLDRLIRTGEFPRPIEISPGIKLWSWRDVLYWSLRAELKSRLVGENPGDTARHGETPGAFDKTSAKRPRSDA